MPNQMGSASVSGKTLEQIAVQSGLVTAEALTEALEEHRRNQAPLLDALLAKGELEEARLLQTVAQELGLPFRALLPQDVDESLASGIPAKMATHYQFMPLSGSDSTVTLAVRDPLDYQKLDELRAIFAGKQLSLVVSTKKEILEAIKSFYGIGAETVERMLAEMPGASEAAEAAAAQAAAAPADLEATEASIIKFANQVIEEAFNGGSTDVHFEPFEGSLRVRYRIDGMLDDVTVPPTLSRFYSAIVSRIKVMAGLNIAEKRRPQDGRISAKVRAHDLDLRVSILPALQGESVHIRLLERDAPLYGLEDLGLLPNGVELFRRALR